MLLLNVVKPGDIISLKLVSGDEVVGKLVSHENDIYTLDTPVVLAMGQTGPTMVPYMITTDPGVHEYTFKGVHVLHAVSTAKQIASQYIQGTTGIVSASNLVG